MISKTVYDLIEQLVSPKAMQAIDILTEFAEFDEFSSDKDEIQQMLELLDSLFEEDMYNALIGGIDRNRAMQDIRQAMKLLKHRLDKILNDTRGEYFPASYEDEECFPCNMTGNGPGLYYFITVSGQVSQTLIAEDGLLAAIAFGA